MEQPYHISFSGGRTSAYMTKLLLDNWSDRYDFVVTFANTGLEHPKTLEFIHNCDRHFGFNTVWLEAQVNPERGKGTSFRIVDFMSADRGGGPFEAVIRKHGIPNAAFPGCTRELKLAPMHAYLKSIGLQHTQIPTAIGIRIDERRRVNPKTVEARFIEYPLIDVWPTDKEDVLSWWSQQPFDLEIDEFEGNCLGCYKKSWTKLFQQIERDPTVFDFHRRMEAEHRFTGPQQGERVFFRKHTDTEGLFKMYQELNGPRRTPSKEDAAENGGCSESCEVFETLIGEPEHP